MAYIEQFNDFKPLQSVRFRKNHGSKSSVIALKICLLYRVIFSLFLLKIRYNRVGTEFVPFNLSLVPLNS